MEVIKEYPSYKDSGVEWIGRIPDRWKVSRIKSLFEIVYRYPTYYGINYVTSGEIEVRGEMLKGCGLIDIENTKPRYISKETSNQYPLTRLKKGDIVMSVRGTMGKIGLVTKSLENSNITANLLRLSPNQRIVFPKWLVWLLENARYKEELDNYSDTTTIKTITVPKLLSIQAPIPDIEEQKKIANFLDYNTTEIDSLIAYKEKLIKLLEEKRQAIITEAVTSGVNPDVKMKNSGVEWIGEIPEHWDKSKICYYSHIVTGGTPNKDKLEYWADGIVNWMSSGEINKEFITSVNNKITLAGLRNSNARLLPLNTVMIALNGQGKTKGKVGVLKIESTCNQSLAGFICNEKNLHYLYLYYYLKSKYKQIRGLVGDGLRDGLSIGLLKSLYVPLPSIEEQIKIGNYLNNYDSSIQNAINQIKIAIEKLKEYRQSLIYEAVTGKIDVREHI